MGLFWIKWVNETNVDTEQQSPPIGEFPELTVSEIDLNTHMGISTH